MASFTVQFNSGQNATEIHCDGYAQEGTMLTFFRFGSDCDTIDAWSQRIASYRIVDISSVVRGPATDSLRQVPVLVAV